jgi:hypothetical protein
MRFRTKSVAHGIASACMLSAATGVMAMEDVERDEWELGAEIYLWGAGIGGNTTAGDEIDLSFSDLFSNLDMGFMGTVAARKGQWSLFADIVYKDVSDETGSTATIIGYPVKTQVNVELKGFISTFAGAYRIVGTDAARFELLAGARYLWLENNLEFDIGGVSEKYSASGRVWDGIVGVRGQADLDDKWYLGYYLDVGTGGSDLTWQALAAVNYRFEKVDASLGYRHLDWDFDDVETFDNLNVSGPYLGVKFHF